MYMVAIRRIDGDPEAQAAALAGAMGESQWEARRRLHGPGPRAVATFAKAVDAERLRGALEAAGFGAVVVDGDSVSGVHVVPRSFELRSDAIQVTLRDGRPFAIRFDRITLLLRGTRIEQEVRTEQVKERRFNLGRAVATGGLMMTKTNTREVKRESEEREGFLQVYAPGVTDFLLLETELLYDSLGDELRPTRSENFARLIELLRERTPHARYDERLLTRGAQAEILGGLLEPETHLDLATALVAATLRERGDDGGGLHPAA